MRHRGFGVGEMVILIAVLIVLTVVLWPVFETPRSGHGRSQCLTNIKQGETSLITYIADFDDRFPDRDRWVDLVMPYSKNDSPYHCPDLGPLNKELYGYAFNSWLAPRKASDPADPTIVPMLYDSINLAKNASDPFLSFPAWPAAKEKPRRNVGFVDGHARFQGSAFKGWKP